MSSGRAIRSCRKSEKAHHIRKRGVARVRMLSLHMGIGVGMGASLGVGCVKEENDLVAPLRRDVRTAGGGAPPTHQPPRRNVRMQVSVSPMSRGGVPLIGRIPVAKRVNGRAGTMEDHNGGQGGAVWWRSWW